MGPRRRAGVATDVDSPRGAEQKADASSVDSRQDRPKSSDDGRGKHSSVADRRRAGGIVVATAAASRVVMLILFFAFDAILEDYDTSARIYSPCRPRHVSPGNSSAVDRTLTLLGISHASNEISDESTLVTVATGRIGFVTTFSHATEWIVRHFPPELFSTSLIQNYPGHNSTVQQALESVVVWDSVFFHRIALCGYEFEQAYAFFPLLPLLMRLLATVTPFRLLLPILGASATIALVGLLLSNAAFVAAAYCLFRLTECVLSDTRLALLSSLFFCLTPSSTFYSAIYSESLFALLSFAAMWRIVSGRWFLASLLIALSAAARSNGVLHAGFFLFSLLQTAGSLILPLLPRQLLHQLFSAAKQEGREPRERHTSYKSTERQADRRASRTEVTGQIAPFLEGKWQLCRTRLLPILLSTALCCLLSFSLLVSLQAFAFTQFCLPAASTKSNLDTETPQDVPPWCLDSVPYIYGYVQRKYWDVGFLRYFQLKQLPNFLLAAPSLLLSLSAILSFARTRPLLFLSLGFISSPSDHHCLLFLPPSNHSKAREQEEEGEEEGEEEREEEGEVEWKKCDHWCRCRGFYSAAALPFLLQLLFMTAVATLVMHVQVATRFLSSSPPLYWFLAHLLTSANSTLSKSARLSSTNEDHRWELFMIRAWVGASLGYAVIGSLLFINFYPFT